MLALYVSLIHLCYMHVYVWCVYVSVRGERGVKDP
jgi:hypothetical protein